MMKMKKIMLVMLILAVAIFALQTIVSATDTTIDIMNALSNSQTINNTTQNTELPVLSSNNEAATNISTNTSTNNTTNNITVNNSTNNTESLPQTGLTEDITIMFFIVLCVASAIFAYAKIRKYNEK